MTTQEANRSGIAGAVTAPLRDVNMLKTKIPQPLIDALNNPYQPPSPYTCAKIEALVAPLDQALGADFDQPASKDDTDLMDKGSDAILGAVAGAAQDIIPLRSWVRKLTGAEQHDRLVAAAITAGGVRRGYLKGLGEVKNCRSPARPAANAPGLLNNVPRPAVTPPRPMTPPPPVSTPAPLAVPAPLPPPPPLPPVPDFNQPAPIGPLPDPAPAAAL